MTRPEYCQIPDEGEPGWEGPCPACGATVEGKDPVNGVCQARRMGPDPSKGGDLFFVLKDKRSGEVVASVRVL